MELLLTSKTLKRRRFVLYVLWIFFFFIGSHMVLIHGVNVRH